MEKQTFLSEDKVNSVLEHFGIKGMKWGVRRTPEQLARARGKKTTASDDDSAETRHKKLLKTTNASTLYKYRKELSNKELQERLNRINMESQLKTLAKKDRMTAEKAIKKALEVGKTASEFYNLYNSPMGKAVKSALNKKAKKGS